MAFVGSLSDVRVPDLLQVLASGGRTGRLTLTRRDAEGTVLLRGGKIFFAASSAVRPTLGHLLLCGGLIAQEQLMDALEEQDRRGDESRLGAILVERGWLSPEMLRAVIRDQITQVIGEFADWEAGFFRFERTEIPDCGEIELDLDDLMLDTGLGPEEVLLAVAARLDEIESASSCADESTFRSLRDVLTETRSPELRGESTIELLDAAAEVVKRVVLFEIRCEDFVGAGQFGVGDDAWARVQKLRVPMSAESVLSRAALQRRTYRGALPNTRWNGQLARALGAEGLDDVVCVPMVVNERTLCVVLGDGVRANGGGAALEKFELRMMAVGLQMEQTLVQRRLAAYEARRSG